MGLILAKDSGHKLLGKPCRYAGQKKLEMWLNCDWFQRSTRYCTGLTSCSRSFFRDKLHT